jgi:hypothetical protein
LGVSEYLLGFWQFWAGQRKGLWTPPALKQWRKAGIFFGAFLAIGIGVNVLSFNLQHFLRSK